MGTQQLIQKSFKWKGCARIGVHPQLRYCGVDHEHWVRLCSLLCSLQLSPSFTPTSVIRKMYESKEKSKEDPVSGKMKISDVKDENQRPNEGIVMALKYHEQKGFGIDSDCFST